MAVDPELEDPTQQAQNLFPASSPGDQSKLGPCPYCHPLMCLGTLFAGLWDKVTTALIQAPPPTPWTNALGVC